MRLQFALFWPAFLLAAWLPLTVDAAPLPAATKAFLQKHGYECHDADTQKGKLRLDNLVTDFASPATAATWGKVFSQLEKRQMPPKKQPQPSDAERQPVLDWLSRELRLAIAARQNAEGRVALRRLNRFEYQNTVQNLLGVEVNPMELLPEDGSAHGFDKVSSALALSPVLVEKLLIYATGHRLEFTDKAVIGDIMRQVKAKKHGFRSLMHEVVASTTFQTK